MSLKEITKDLHTDAERTVFAKKLLTGVLTSEEYANYLWQMVLVYNGIETAARSQGMLVNLPDIERAHKIYQDCIELVGPNHNLKWLPVVIEYYQYLLSLNYNAERKHLIKAHLYCRHMGDLYGGQMIAKKVPGKGRFYEFKDADNLKTAIRAELTDDLGDEARVAFEWAIKIMKALNKDE
jgi:heme oxygenase (biliverdin-producing, ferredoxin)